MREENEFKSIYLLAPLPIVLWKSCDIRGPRGPNRCGGRPLASNRAKEKEAGVVELIDATNPI